ncbi:hypothetical protein M0813_30097 [Anaeramoeba flamelloides]|uniref:Uncharacterized protein n=1 Tax=Anaeramoeba flamelloides TaxID=1746091 RepID=A0ABQ8XL14_9EUKA|nr:hypothetical protein M0813_30091 [Anaeramoeba flamelloides]KAJ6233305.1 hypothetical protein M0813_30097 [Anaeramoeba flamelloides]
MYTYLVDPARSKCLSKRLSHASVSISPSTTKLQTAPLAVIIYLIMDAYLIAILGDEGGPVSPLNEKTKDDSLFHCAGVKTGAVLTCYS